LSKWLPSQIALSTLGLNENGVFAKGPYTTFTEGNCWCYATDLLTDYFSMQKFRPKQIGFNTRLI